MHFLIGHLHAFDSIPLHVWILSDSIFHLHDIRQLLHLKAQQNQILLTNAGMCCFVHFLNSMAIFARSYTLGSSFPIPTSFHRKNGRCYVSDKDAVLSSTSLPYQTSISLEIRDLLPFLSLAYRYT